MKKFIIKNKEVLTVILWLVLALIISYKPAHALNWTVANEKTVAWDAVTTLSNDDPIPAGDTIEYELFLVSNKSTDREADKILKGTTAALEFTYTFDTEGRWIAGIRTARIPEGLPEERTVSEILWSDDPTVPVPFGFIYLLKPGKVSVFHPK